MMEEGLTGRSGRYRSVFDPAWHVVEIPFGYDADEIEEWLTKHVHSGWSWKTSYGRLAEYAFEDPNEACFFKMRWR